MTPRLLADLRRAVEAAFPDRADAMMRVVESMGAVIAQLDDLMQRDPPTHYPLQNAYRNLRAIGRLAESHADCRKCGGTGKVRAPNSPTLDLFDLPPIECDGLCGARDAKHLVGVHRQGGLDTDGPIQKVTITCTLPFGHEDRGERKHRGQLGEWEWE